MAYLSINNVAIRGLAAAVPQNTINNVEAYNKWGDYSKVEKIIGIKQRHVVPENMCVSDLFYAAGEKIISELGWNKEEIDAIVVVCQTPDYIQPPTACILQYRLGLSENCFATDIPHGCSGWVYGLSIISSLMQNGSIRKGLLFSGDTTTKCVSHEDKSTWPLFGDAGTVTALEYTGKESNEFLFCLNTNGAGYKDIIIKDGGYRNPFNENTLKMVDYGDGVIRNANHLAMEGMSVFSFAISKAPKQVKELISHFNINEDEIDYYILHQANMFIDEKIRKKMKLPKEKVLYCIQEYGNTSSGSIPLTLASQASNSLRTKHLTLIGSGVGVGLSWASVYFETENVICPNIIEI